MKKVVSDRDAIPMKKLAFVGDNGSADKHATKKVVSDRDATPVKKLAFVGDNGSADNHATKKVVSDRDATPVKKLAFVGDNGSADKHATKKVISDRDATTVKKLAFVGDNGSNISELVCDLVMAYVHKGLPRVDFRTRFYDIYRLSVRGTNTRLDLDDVAMMEPYDSLRQLCYSNTDVLLVCFVMDSQASLKSACNKWIPEIRHRCPGVPYILLGMNAERKSTMSLDESEVEERNDMIRKSGAWLYLECSVPNMEGVNDVFESCERAATQPKASISGMHRNT